MARLYKGSDCSKDLAIELHGLIFGKNDLNRDLKPCK